MLRAKYYNNIDTMPIYNYLKVVEDSNYSYLIVKNGLFGDITKAFENIQRQLVDRFGISESYAELLELQREICELKCEVAITGNRFQNTFIRIKEAEIERLNQIKGSTSQEIKIYLEKWLKFPLNLHKLSVAEWFAYIKQFSQSQPQKTE